MHRSYVSSLNGLNFKGKKYASARFYAPQAATHLLLQPFLVLLYLNGFSLLRISFILCSQFWMVFQFSSFEISDYDLIKIIYTWVCLLYLLCVNCQRLYRDLFIAVLSVLHALYCIKVSTWFCLLNRFQEV